MAVREGKWKCEYCGAVNLGRDMSCQSCGAVRGPDVKFFLDENAGEVTDENLAGIARGGADWHCDYCGTDNRASSATCKQCGAPKEGMKSRQEKVMASGGSTSAPRKTAPPPVKKESNVLPIVLGAVAVVVLAIGAFFIFGGKEALLVLERGEWSREIAIEEQQWIEYTEWDEQVPSSATIIERWEEQRGTEQVQVGTERVKTGTRDKGNGFFEDIYEDRPIYEERPVYDIKVRYKVQEWVVYRKVLAEGTLADPAAWPDPKLSSTDREGTRKEEAVLYFYSTDPEMEGKTFTWDKLTPSDLSLFKEGGKYKAEVFGSKVRRFLED